MRRLARPIATVMLPVVALVSCQGATARASPSPTRRRRSRSPRRRSPGRRRASPTKSRMRRTWASTRARIPGDEAMRAWRTGDSPYSWTGYYLPSPCHQDEGWSGKRDTLTAMGYGLAVLYVGQQTWGRKPGAPHMERVSVPKKVTSYVGQGQQAPQGDAHGDEDRAAQGAAADARRDLQRRFRQRRTRHARGRRRRAAHRARRLPARHDGLPRPRADGRAAPVDARLLLRVGARRARRRTLRARHLRPHRQREHGLRRREGGVSRRSASKSEPPFWVAKSRGFDTTKHPSEMGHTFAAIWQGVLDVKQTWNGHKIPIDVNVAALPSPSRVVAEIAQGFRGGE